MISPAAAAALERIQARANDVLQAYTSGGSAAFGDVNLNARAPEHTQDPLSVAAPNGAYFAVRTTHGATAYTRDGGFAIVNGTLTGSDGSAVLGYRAGDQPGAVPRPIVLPRADVALGRCADVRVESDGTVSYTRSSIDPRTQERRVERVVAGRVALARFPAGTAPVRLDATHVAAPAGIPPHLGTPADGTFAGLATYARDTGSVDIDVSLQKLADAYIAFSALHAAQRAHGEVSKTAMDLVK